MVKTSIRRAVLVLAIVAIAVIGARAVTHAQQAAPAVVRKVLIQQDLTIPGYQTALVSVEIPVGGREGRHTHPGTLLVLVQEGALTLDYEGRPTVTYKAGESFYVEPGKIHEGINKGNAPIKALASFVTEKGKPLTTQVQK